MNDSPLSLYFRQGYPGKLKPVIIKLYISGQPRAERSTGVKVELHQWDGQHSLVVNHPQADRLNKKIGDEVKKQQKEIDKREALEIPLTNDLIRKPLKVALREYAETLAKDPKIRETQLGRLEEYNGGPVKLPAINAEFLRGYTKFLQAKLAPKTVADALEWLQHVINLAIIDKKLLASPFVGFPIPDKGKSDPEWLLDHERKLFEDLIPTYDYDQDSSEYSVLIWFLIACNTGLRQGDWGKVDLENRLFQVNGEWRFRVQAEKNGNWVVMPVGETLLKLFDRARGLVLPRANTTINTNIQKLVDRINSRPHSPVKLKKNISSHVGRHTFGFRCACAGLDQHLLAELLSVGIRVVKVYYHLSGEQITKQTSVLGTW